MAVGSKIEEPCPATSYSLPRRIVMLLAQVSSVFFFAGLIIGFQQLRPILIQNGVFSWLCAVGNAGVCAAQTKALDDMFDVSASLNVFAQFPAGLCLDFFGPRPTARIGLAVFIAGCVLQSISSLTVRTTYVAFQCWGVGGPFLFLASMQAPQLFPQHSAFILTLANGCFGGGGFVFYILGLINKAGVSLPVLMYALSAFGVMYFVGTFFLWNKFVKSSTIIVTSSPKPLEPQSPLQQAMHTARLKIIEVSREMVCIDFLFLVVFFPIMVAKANFLLSTLSNQLEDFDMSPQNVSDIDDAFGLMLPFLGIACGALGSIVDRFGIAPGLLTLLGISSLSSVLGFFGSFASTIVRLVAFSLYFGFLYGLWAAITYKRFSHEHYGALWGVVAVVSGCVNFITIPLTDLSVSEHSFLPVNIGFLISTDVFVWYAAYAYQTRNREQQGENDMAVGLLVEDVI